MNEDYMKYTKAEMNDMLIERDNELRTKKKGKFSQKIVMLVIALNVIFTIGVLYVFLKIGNEPMALVGAWFGFTTVELWSLSKIKREEIREDSGDEC